MLLGDNKCIENWMFCFYFLQIKIISKEGEYWIMDCVQVTHGE